MKTARNRAYLFLLLTALIWGWASPIVKYSTEFIPPLIMLLYRFALSALIAVAFLPTYKHHLPKTPSAWTTTIIYGFLVSSVTLSLFFVGVKNSSSIVAAMGSVFQPVLAAVAGVIFLKEHLTAKEKTGLSIALFGSLVITFEPLLNGNQPHLGSLFGNLLLIGSRLTDTISTVLAKNVLRLKISPLALTHITFIIGFFTMIPIVLFFHTPFQITQSILTAPITAHLGVMYMAIFSGVIAYTLFHMAEKTIEIGEATLSYYLHPLFSAPLSFFWLKEQFTPVFMVGCLIVAAGVIFAGNKQKIAKVNS